MGRLLGTWILLGEAGGGGGGARRKRRKRRKRRRRRKRGECMDAWMLYYVAILDCVRILRRSTARDAISQYGHEERHMRRQNEEWRPRVADAI